MIIENDTKLYPTFSFSLVQTDTSGTNARLGKIYTPHGYTETPVFMPVATRAVVKTLTPMQLEEAGSTILLSNTYHLALRPGEELIQKMGGLHHFMRWNRPILTDSGGFQVFSLSDLRKINDNEVIFRSHINGDLFIFTPEKVIKIQEMFGSDIIMPLDHCIGWPCTYEEAYQAAKRSLTWLKRSIEAKKNSHQALFGIVQGSVFTDIRCWCAQEMVALDLPGYSIGGLAVGENKEIMRDIIQIVNTILPINKPRYLMGVGTPVDIVKAVANGVDMFDCVMPTRNARGGGAFTFSGKLQIRNACYEDDPEPLDPECHCYCCRTFSKAYLHHLFSKKVEDILGLVMLTLHNITFYHRLMEIIRKAIRNNSYLQFMQNFLSRYHEN